LGTHQTTDRPDLQKTYSAPKRSCFESLYTEQKMGRDFSSFIILFDVSKLMMLKKELIIASINVVESEWVDLYKISCYRL
jgi:hypothetical protein